MEEAQGKKKRRLQDLRDKPITQDQLAALLDITPRAINEMRKRGVLPAPTTTYPVAWTDRKALTAALREIGVLGQFVAIQIERGVL
jgi:DNA-binding XRE family transcriptional regulator